MNKLWVCSASLVLTAGSSLPALGQTEGGLQLEEVVVTAEKRAVNLQKVSTSIEVKSGEELRKQGKKRLDEIMEGTVGIQSQGSPTGTAFFIRGVPPAQAGRGDPVTTPIIVDGITQNRTESVRGATLDLGQVEVMRGPQSTGLGANSLSGAISLVSNKPVFQFEGSGTLELGNYDKMSTEGVLNIPLADNQAVRVAVSKDLRDGFYSNGSGETDLLAARVKYRLQFSDTLDAVATISHQHIDGNGSSLGVADSGLWVPYTGQTALGNEGGAMGAWQAGAGCVPDPMGAAARGCVVNGSTYSALYSWSATGNGGQNFRQRSNAWDDGTPYQRWGFPVYQRSNLDSASVELNWNTALGTVTFLPSYQKSHSWTQEAPTMGAAFNQENIALDTVTADLRINSNQDSRLTWQAGLYYSKDDYKQNLFTSINFPGTAAMGGPVGDCVTSTVNCYAYSVTPDQTRTGWSGYANAELNVLDTLRLVGGVRYNKDEATVQELNGAVPGTSNGPDNAAIAAKLAAGSPTGYFAGKAEWKKTTYRGGVEWDVTPNVMVYAIYSTGYTPGTLNGMSFDQMTGVATPGLAVTLKQITAGAKSQWLDNRLQLNAEYFRSTFFNRGVSIPTAYSGTETSATCSFGTAMGALLIANGTAGGACASISSVTSPELLSEGLDMDLTWLISANDRLTLTGEWLDSYYSKRPIVNNNPSLDLSASGLVAAAAAQSPSVVLDSVNAAPRLSAFLNDALNAVVGAQLQNAPKYSATLDYQHSFDFSNGSRLTPRIAATYKDKYWSVGGGPGGPTLSTILANTKSLYWQQSYVKWDAYATWNSPSGKVTVTGYLRNIAEEVIMTSYGAGTPTSPGTVQLEAPRTFGVTLSASF